MTLDIKALIDEYAAKTRVTDAARKKWRQRGVPYRARLEIIEWAASEGISVSPSDFAAEPVDDSEAA
jgi:hypothetical protein